MKKLLIAFMLFATIHGFTQAKNTQTLKSTLSHATVYYGYGAELDHNVKATLTDGLQEIVITNVASQVDGNTIQVACPENVVLMSYRFNTVAETAQSPAVVKMMDTIIQLQKQLSIINNEYATTEDLLSRITRLIETDFTSIGGKEKTMTSEEFIKLLEYYSTKVQALKATLYALQLKRADVEEKIRAVNRRIAESNKLSGNNGKVYGQIILQLMTKSATLADFNISYFTRNAGWIPAYDLRVKTIDNSFKLAYKAAVSQTTGIDWKEVKLSLSTSNPNQGSNVPLITPWYLQMFVPELYNQMLRGRAAGVATNRMQSMSPLLKEVIVKGEDAYEKKDMARDVADPSDVSVYTNLAEGQLYTSFDIDLPYDIPADGKAYNVAIKEENIKATYKHYAVPKLDKDAFLVAEINDWETLDLLPGEANIIMDNVYLGKSFIDPNTTMDTLNLSMGRDKRIAVKRMLMKEFSKSRVKGDNKTETFTYEITVKNNKKQPISMLLKDQYPLSTLKEIEVALEESVGAEVNAELATLNWKINLEPGEIKQYRFTYSIKYPKDKKIMNIR